MKTFLFWIIFIGVWAACSSFGIIGFCLGWMPATILASVIK